MEMTVDEAKKILHDFLNNPYGAPVGGLNNAIKLILSNEDKYEKIEQIYSDYLKYMNPDNLADRIGEVLEDGNDD